MSNNKRLRASKTLDDQDTFQETLEEAITRMENLQRLINDTVFHDTYSPLIIKWLDPLYVVKTIPLVCKWLNNLLFNNGQTSKMLIKELVKNDFGSFIERCPKMRLNSVNIKPRDLLKDMIRFALFY